MHIFYWNCSWLPDETGIRLMLHTLASEYGGCAQWRKKVVDPNEPLIDFEQFVRDTSWYYYQGEDTRDIAPLLRTLTRDIWSEAVAIHEYTDGPLDERHQIVWWCLFRAMRLEGIPVSPVGVRKLIALKQEIQKRYLSDRRLYGNCEDELPF